MKRNSQKSFTLKDLAKKYRNINKSKGYRGWYEATKGSKQSQGATETKNAGNVLYNNAFFNQAMGSINPSANISGIGTADGGVGMVSSAPAGGGVMGEGLTTSINWDKEVKDKFITFDHFTPTEEGAFFIMKDGTFLYPYLQNIDEREEYEEIEFEHNFIDQYFKMKGLFNKQVSDGSEIMRDLGALRVNNLTELAYVELPNSRPNFNQYEALEEVLYYLYRQPEIFDFNVFTSNGQQIAYSTDDYFPEDIINRIKRYYSSGKLYESLNVKIGLNEIVELISKYYKIKSQPVDGQSYILPNGDFIELNEDSHESIEDIFVEAELRDEIDYFESSEYDLTLIDDFNSIRISDGKIIGTNPYVMLPRNNLTSSQYESLENWLWGLNAESVYIGSANNKNEGADYSLVNYTPEEIIKKIKRFYSSGHLYENLNENLIGNFELVPYISENGRNYFQEYMDELKSSKPFLYKKTISSLEFLKLYGNRSREPLSKKLDDNLFELRSESKEGWSRIFYFFDKGKVIILANGFDKKSDKTPQSELDRAKELKKDYERRNQ